MIGGVKEFTGEEFGVYVKRILPGGLASSDEYPPGRRLFNSEMTLRQKVRASEACGGRVLPSQELLSACEVKV